MSANDDEAARRARAERNRDAPLDDLLAEAAEADKAQLKARIDAVFAEGAPPEHMRDFDELEDRGGPFYRALYGDELFARFPDEAERQSMIGRTFALISPVPHGGIRRTYWECQPKVVDMLTKAVVAATNEAALFLPRVIPGVRRLGGAPMPSERAPSPSPAPQTEAAHE